MKKKICELLGLVGLTVSVKFLSDGNNLGIIILILSGFIYVMSAYFTSNN